MPYNGDPHKYYNEAQLEVRLAKHASLFARGEVPDFDTDEGTYMIGVAVRK